MKLSYIGPHIDGVTVPLPTGGFITATHGGTVDVPDSVATGLLEQETNWVKAVVTGRRTSGCSFWSWRAVWCCR